MFGYEMTAMPKVRTRMIAERAAARSRWPFLTSLDLSTIHNEEQLAAMVKDRSGQSYTETHEDVERWAHGYRARIAGEPLATPFDIAHWSHDAEAPQLGSAANGNDP